MALTSHLTAIGVAADTAAARQPSLAWLQELYHAHVTTIPFNAIDLYQGGKPLQLQLTSVSVEAEEKLIARGGVCMEKASVMLHSLRKLGFSAYRAAGDVYMPGGDVNPFPLVHASIIVEVEGDSYLLDVGMPLAPFGPVKLEEGTLQITPNGSLCVMTYQQEEGEPLRWLLNRVGPEGEFVPVYRFEHKEQTDAGGELSAARDWCYTEASPFRHGWLLQIYRPDYTSVTLAEGSWAGSGVPAGQAKYVVRPPPSSGLPETTTYLPGDGAEVARLIAEEFNVKGQPLPIKKGPVEGTTGSSVEPSGPIHWDIAGAQAEVTGAATADVAINGDSANDAPADGVAVNDVDDAETAAAGLATLDIDVVDGAAANLAAGVTTEAVSDAPNAAVAASAA